MAEINFALLQPVDTGALSLQGFQTGMAMVKQVQTKHALSNYLTNPDDPGAYNALAYYDPGTASAMEEHRARHRKELLDQEELQRQRTIGGMAATGDTTGARTTALQSGDFDLASKIAAMDEPQQKRAAAFLKLAGPLAFKMRQMQDPGQRKAFLDANRPLLEAQGIDGKAIDGFDVSNDQVLDGYIAGNRTIDQMIDDGKITWHQQGEQPSFATNSMGQPVGTQNPYAGGGNAPPAPTAGNGDARGNRNNNPLNLTKSEFTTGQPGYAGTDSGGRYAKFESPEAGMAAGQKLLGSYIQRGFNTPAKIIERWAPASENGATSTANYITYVSHAAGLAPDQPVTPDKIPALMQAMQEFENGGRSGGQRRVASVGGVPHVSSKAEFDKLPSGTPFIAPDGSHRVKP